MNLYYELMQHPIFNIKDVALYYKNENSARTALGKLLREGIVLKIRNDMYTCVSGETFEPVASRYQIGSAITDSAYISHHSAMEMYGATDQVFYEVYVSSNTRFNDFEFSGVHFHFIKSKCSIGIESPEFSGGIRMTDKERTVIDCIKDMDSIAGPEETIENVASMKRLSEEKLLKYLESYNNQFLYQKTGLILSHIKDQLKISDQFFMICHSKIGKSRRYLTSGDCSGNFDKVWNVVVPNDIFAIKNGESNDIVG